MIKNTAGDRLYHQIKHRLNEAYEEIHLSDNHVEGKYCKSVENKLKIITGRKHAKLFTSATAAIQTALLAWDIKDKNVACANYSFVASANQAALLNNVEFTDVDDRGLMLLEEKFNHDAVIPVSLYGNTIDYDNLKIGDNTKVIVDSAQSLGTKYKGKPDGSFGDAAVFSFARNKPIPTAGTHGAMVWDDDSMTDRIRAVAMNGKLSRDSGIVSYGINGSPFELQAAQIDIGLDYIDEWQNKRSTIHDYYVGEFEHLPLQIIQANEYCESNYHKFVMLSDTRDNLKDYLHEHGVQAIAHYTDNFANFFGSTKKFPGTDKLCQTVLTLPNHPWLTDNEIETVANKVKDFYK